VSAFAIMKKRTRFIILALLLIAVGASVLYFLTRSTQRPKCDCVFPNSGAYGVIRDGTCVPTDCERKANQ
jgi:hypothetical protein